MSERSTRATVVYADVSGFTALSEKLDPEQVTDVMNRCFTALEAVLADHGGRVYQYLGDCVLAVFGGDGGGGGGDADRAGDVERDAGDGESGGDGAVGAVLAAARMMRAVREFDPGVDVAVNLDLHVGMETGDLLLGAPRNEGEAATLAGLPLRIAARLEDASQRGSILVGPGAYAVAADSFQWREMPPVAAGAGGQEVEVHELADVAALAARWPSVADRPEPSPSALALGRRVGRAGERRQVTILFAELAGFAHLAGHLPPAELAALLGAWHDIVDNGVAARSGYLDKYLGAGVMVLFGAPNAIENAPQQAVNLAIDLRRQVAEWSAGLDLPVSLGVRAGINTGLAIAADIGGAIRRDFTVLGDAVNVAARLKESAEAGVVYVGERAWRQTSAAFEYRDTGGLRLHGKSGTVPCWELLSGHERAHRTRSGGAAGTLHSRMVGRDRELERLRARVAGAREGAGGVVGIVGEAGLGKTRLASELLAEAERDGARVLVGRCLSNGANASYHPFVDLLRAWAGIGEEDDDERAVAALRQALAVLGLHDAEETQIFIASLMGLSLGPEATRRLEAMDGDARERLTLREVRELLAAIATSGAGAPLLLVIEDLHWADESSMRLLASLLRLAEQAGVLLVLVTRPVESPEAEALLAAAASELGERTEIVTLAPLDEQYAARLVEALLDIEDLPAATRRLILAKAEGNPFFLEEVVRTLIEQDAVRFVDGRYRITEKIHDVEIPGTVGEVILARVDRLDERTREVVQLASVVGRTFSYGMLEEVMSAAGRLDERLGNRLEQLTEKQILRADADSWDVTVGARSALDEIEYVFRHALAQQAIYESLLHKTRRALHADVARTIEAHYADRLNEFAGMLSFHYLRAEDWDAAETWLFRAGEEAAKSAASSEALKLFEQASKLFLERNPDGGDPAKRMQLERNIALAHWNKGNLTESIEHFNNTLEFLGDSVPRNAVTRYARFARDLASTLARLYVLGPSTRKPRDLEHERLVLGVVYARSRAQATSGDAVQLFVDNINAIRRCSIVDSRLLDQSCGIFATSAGLFSFAALSFDVARRFLEWAERTRRPDSVADEIFCGTFRTVYSLLTGDWRDETAMNDELVDAGIRAGEFWDVNTYLGLECDRLLRRGEFARAQHQLDRLAEMRDAYGYEFAASNHDGMRAMLLLEQRRTDEAMEAAERYDATRHEPSLKVLGGGMKARLEVLRGELDAARDTLAHNREIARGSGSIAPWHAGFDALARLALDIADIDAGRDPGRQARRHRRKALGIAGSVAEYRVEAHRLAGTLAWLGGDRRGGVAAWERSIAFAEDLGARPELARTLAEVAARADADVVVAGRPASLCGAQAEALRQDLGIDA